MGRALACSPIACSQLRNKIIATRLVSLKAKARSSGANLKSAPGDASSLM